VAKVNSHYDQQNYQLLQRIASVLEKQSNKGAATTPINNDTLLTDIAVTLDRKGKTQSDEKKQQIVMGLMHAVNTENKGKPLKDTLKNNQLVPQLVTALQ